MLLKYVPPLSAIRRLDDGFPGPVGSLSLTVTSVALSRFFSPCVLFQLHANLFSFLSLSTFRIRRLRCFAITLPLSFFCVFSAHTIRSPGTDRSILSLSLSSRTPPHSFSPLVSTMLVIANTTPTTLAYFVAPSLFHSLPLSDDLNHGFLSPTPTFPLYRSFTSLVLSFLSLTS